MKHFVKQSVKALLVGVLAFGLMAIPFSSSAAAATRYEIDPAFVNCTRYTFSHRSPMTNNTCIGKIQRFLDTTKWIAGASGVRISNSQWPTMQTRANHFDNLYGPRTARAVKAYQASKGGYAGPADGIVGPKTWMNIYNDCVTKWKGAGYRSPVCYRPVTSSN